MRPTKYQPPKPFESHIHHKKARIRKKIIKYYLEMWSVLRPVEIYMARKWDIHIPIRSEDKYMTKKSHEFIQEFIDDNIQE